MEPAISSDMPRNTTRGYHYSNPTVANTVEV